MRKEKSETLLINTECEMVEELKARLEANSIVDTETHQVAAQEDLLALLDANLGVAMAIEDMLAALRSAK